MEEMTEEEIGQTISQSRLAILSLARGSRAYAFPLFYAYRDGTFYFHSHPGRKDDFIRATEEACLTIVRAVTDDEWYSVMAFGHVRDAEHGQARQAALDALSSVPAPPEMGRSETGAPLRSDEDVEVWMLEPHELSGRKSEHPPPGTGEPSDVV